MAGWLVYRCISIFIIFYYPSCENLVRINLLYMYRLRTAAVGFASAAMHTVPSFLLLRYGAQYHETACSVAT